MKLYFINCHFPPCLEVSGALEKCFLNKKALFHPKFECRRELFKYAINMQLIFQIYLNSKAMLLHQ